MRSFMCLHSIDWPLFLIFFTNLFIHFYSILIQAFIDRQLVSLHYFFYIAKNDVSLGRRGKKLRKEKECRREHKEEINGGRG